MSPNVYLWSEMTENKYYNILLLFNQINPTSVSDFSLHKKSNIHNFLRK